MAVTIYYLSDLIGKPVFDPTGRPVGLIGDFVVRLGTAFPPVTGLALRLGGAGKRVAPRATFLHWSLVSEVSATGLRLASARLDILAFRRRPGEMLLDNDLLDQQVIDLDGRKLVRVNDVQLVSAGHKGTDLRLAGIDVGALGLFRRMGIQNFAHWLDRHGPVHVADRVIPWEGVEPVDLADLPPELGVNGRPTPKHGLQLTHQKLAALHPSDVADLVEQLSAPDRATIMEALDAETAAETLGELEPDMQADVLEDLPTKAAVSILAELPPDEAADVLADLTEERANELLQGLAPEDAEAVRELMAYPDDVAGGMMTTDYIALSASQSAQQTIESLRKLAPPAEEVYYLYVVDDQEHLLGVLSLRDLIVAPPNTKLADIVKDAGEVVSVPADMERDEVVRVVEKYNLLALPVVDEHERLVGVITVDDALAAAVPEERRWLPRLHR